MITLGIDLSSQAKATAASLIDWSDTKAEARPVEMQCTDQCLDDLIEQAHVIGIDAPFGWPVKFAAAVADWTDTIWDTTLRDTLRFRLTDRVLYKRQKVWPLSVSTDRIALPAMRAMALLRRNGVRDRSGDGRFFEVYPAGSLREWKFTDRGYKHALKAGNKSARLDILAELRRAMPWLDVADDYGDSSDALDALIASLTARCAAQERTFKPVDNEIEISRIEGWIHLPTGLPTL